MGWAASAGRGSVALVGMDPGEEAGLYMRSRDEFIEARRADGLWRGQLSGEPDQSPSLHHQAGEIERFVVDTAGDTFAHEVDVIVSLPGGEYAQAVAFGDAVEGWSGIAPYDTFGGDSSGWMLTLLPSADWFDFPAPAADPWA